MYKINSGLFIKIMLCIAMAFVQGCSDKKSSNNKYIANRRAPEANPMVDDVQKAKMMALKEKSSVKREKDEYDSYQDYQSNEAPVSLKDIKRIKRRPVLNIKELNEIMDSKSKVIHTKKSKPRVHNEEVNSSEKPCTEANCNLKKVITYNKQQAKKTNTSVPVMPAPKDAVPVANVLSAPTQVMPKVVMPKVVMPVVPAPKDAVPVANVPSAPTQVMPKVVMPAPAPKDVEPVSPVPSAPMQVLPKVVVPAPKDASPVASAQSTAMPVMPKVDSPSSIMVPDLPKVESPPAETFSGNESATPPMAKFTESQSKNKIGTVSTLLIKFYFNIKNKVQNLFIGSEE